MTQRIISEENVSKDSEPRTFRKGFGVTDSNRFKPPTLYGLEKNFIGRFDEKPIPSLGGKGKKLRRFVYPERLADRLRAYAYEKNLEPHKRFFKVNRSRTLQVIKETSVKSRLQKRVYPHQHRHSDAIERLRQTGNPKALQLHLGHASTVMTMRYLSTLTQEDAIRINQEVSFDV